MTMHKCESLPADKRPGKGFIRNEYGTWVTSRIDERNLRAIATRRQAGISPLCRVRTLFARCRIRA